MPKEKCSNLMSGPGITTKVDWLIASVLTLDVEHSLIRIFQTKECRVDPNIIIFVMEGKLIKFPRYFVLTSEVRAREDIRSSREFDGFPSWRR